MDKNVGKSDKWVRLILGIVLFPMLFLVKGHVKWLGLLSLPLLSTALTSKCGLYTVLGVNTCKLEE